MFKTTIYKVIEPLGTNVKYCLGEDLGKYRGVKKPINILIPDKLFPSDDLSGTVYLKLNGPKGKYSLLKYVLTTDLYNQKPAIRWYDDEHKYWRSVSLEVEGETKPGIEPMDISEDDDDGQ